MRKNEVIISVYRVEQLLFEHISLGHKHFDRIGDVIAFIADYFCKW